MVNNTQSPGKGLLDVQSKAKADSAQAGNPAEAGAKATGQDGNFAAALVQAQDQKDAKADGAKGAKPQAAAKLTKGETKTQAHGKTTGKTAQRTDKGKDQDEKSKIQAHSTSDQTQIQQAMAQLMSTQSQAQAQAHQKAHEGSHRPAQPSHSTANAAQARSNALKAAAAAQAKADAAVAGGVPVTEAVAAAQQAALVSQRAALSAQEATIKAQEAALQSRLASQAMAAPAVASGYAHLREQPIVIQAPLALPVDVIEVEGSDDSGVGAGPAVGGLGAVRGGAGRAMTASQDFLAQLGQARSFLTGAVHGHGSNAGLDALDRTRGERSKAGHDKERDSSIGMLLPQLGGHHKTVTADAATAIPVSGPPVEITPSRAGRSELANTVALASEVNTLAARGGGSVRMKVMPEALGELTIHVQKDGGKLDVKFDAQSHEAREALAQAMPELRQILTASRHDVGSLEVSGGAAGAVAAMTRDGTGVSVGAFSSSSQFTDWQQGQQGQQGQQQGRNQNGSNAWDRYMSQQENRDQRQYRGGRGYRSYQDALGA